MAVRGCCPSRALLLVRGCCCWFADVVAGLRMLLLVCGCCWFADVVAGSRTMLLVCGRCCWFADDVAGWSADDVARAGVGPAERRTIGRSPVSGGRLALRQVAVDGRKGAAPTIRLPLDSVDPPAGPRAPPSVLKDDPVGAAESRPHAAPRGAASPCGDVPHDMFEAPGIGVLGWSGRGCADDWRGRASLQ